MMSKVDRARQWIEENSDHEGVMSSFYNDCWNDWVEGLGEDGLVEFVGNIGVDLGLGYRSEEDDD